MGPFFRYTVLRLALLLAVVAALYAIGARGALLLLMALLISAALSFILLRRPRDEVAQRIAQRAEGRIDSRLARKAAEDNAAEDADADR